MSHDLLFHIVPKNLFKSSIEDREYIPESIEEQGFIHCSTGFQINDTANRIFRDKSDLLLLIIDTKRVEVPIKYEEDPEVGKEFPHIYGPLNTIAILDKIDLEPNEDGRFDLEFSSN